MKFLISLFWIIFVGALILLSAHHEHAGASPDFPVFFSVGEKVFLDGKKEVICHSTHKEWVDTDTFHTKHGEDVTASLALDGYTFHAYCTGEK